MCLKIYRSNFGKLKILSIEIFQNSTDKIKRDPTFWNYPE